jgi:ferredoxin/flavodoxin
MIKNIDFYYFTGTGNTLLVVNRMSETFRNSGINVTLNRMENSDPALVNRENVIGLAFPVMGFSTYRIVWDFVRALPQANGTRVFMVDTLAGWSGCLVGPLKITLDRKGYKTVGAKEIIMPANVFYVYPEKASRLLIGWGLKQAGKFAARIVSGKARWRRVPLFSDIAYLFYENLLNRMMFAKWNQNLFKFRADEGKCNKCGKCADICPLDNIKMDEYPVHGSNCAFCMRCSSWCPQKAIPCGFNFKGKTYTAPGITI